MGLKKIVSAYALTSHCTRNISKPKTIAHVDAESPEIVSGIATPLPNGTAQTIAATTATMSVKNPSFVLDVRKKATLKKNNDIGKKTKKVTEA